MKKLLLLFVVLVLLFCTGLGFAQEPEYNMYLPVVLRPLQVTKTAQALTIHQDPNEGTFRITRTECYSYGNPSYGDWYGDCYANFRNDSYTLLIVDAVTITSDDTRVNKIELQTIIPMALNAQSYGNLQWYYSLHADAEPGSIIFDIEITCVGY